MARGNITQGHPDRERLVSDRDVEVRGTWPGDFDSAWSAEGPGLARVSRWGGLGLILGVVSVCAALTGLLAPEAAAVGVLGLLVSVGGLVAASRPAVTGRGLAGLGGILSLVAIALAVLAMSGRYSWPNSNVDEVSRWHRWLVERWAWLGRW